MFFCSFTPADISPPCSGSVLFLKSVNHHLNLVSSFRPVLRRGKLCGSRVRIWNCLHYMLQCFSNGLEHIKLKMNSGSSRHHVARCLSLHFPFSGCSIMTTAVTFIACVCLCLCAYTVFGPYAWRVSVFMWLCPPAIAQPCATALYKRSCVEAKDHSCLTPAGREVMHIYLF